MVALYKVYNIYNYILYIKNFILYIVKSAENKITQKIIGIKFVIITGNLSNQI